MSSNHNRKEPISKFELESWRNHPATQLVLHALELKRNELTEKVLQESDNIEDSHLDRRLVHYNGASRALTQVLDSEELVSLLDDYGLLKEQETTHAHDA